jgi:hypothetical protein
VAALALVASTLFGHWLPNPLGAVLARVPLLSSLGLLVAFPLIVMVPVLVGASAHAGWRTASVGAGVKLGLVVTFLTTALMLAVLVIGLALGQPQLLWIGLSWQSLRDLTLTLATTTALGTLLGVIGGAAGAALRSYFTPSSRGGG